MRYRFSHLLLLAALSSCSEGTAPDPATTVADVAISAPRTNIAVGTTLQLTADASNAAGTILVGKTINWISRRPDIATVTSLGLVTGVATGVTVIVASAENRTDSLAISVQAPNRITLTSDVGDYIGGGGTYAYTKANAILSATSNGTSINVGVAGNEGWNGVFQAPSGGQIAPGTYANATRWPFQGSGPGLSWDGEGRGCNALTGSFTIDSLTWSAGPGSTLTSLDMRFEQHCEGVAAALRGTIHWRSDDPTTPPGPVVPIPANLWRPPAGAVPASGDVVYLQSDGGDFIGQGATHLFTSGMVVGGNSHHVSVAVGAYNGDFESMSFLAELQAGYYGNLKRWPFHSPLAGGLSWTGNSRGCNTLTGWFAVDRVKYVSGTLVGIEVRFEQHCEGVNPALRGLVRWGQFTN